MNKELGRILSRQKARKMIALPINLSLIVLLRHQNTTFGKHCLAFCFCLAVQEHWTAAVAVGQAFLITIQTIIPRISEFYELRIATAVFSGKESARSTPDWCSPHINSFPSLLLPTMIPPIHHHIFLIKSRGFAIFTSRSSYSTCHLMPSQR